jgi:SAM-dependent methyltransferase
VTWDDPPTAEEYLHRIGTSAPRQAGEDVLREVLPPAPTSALDLGCGDGRLAALVLDERPAIARIVAVDVSPPMLAAARDRFAGEPRVDIRAWDLRNPIAPLGPFDVIVSGFAVHHLGHERKQALFTEVAQQLRPGGVFANLEVVASATPELHAAFRVAIGREADDPEDRLAPVEAQLEWMRAAGLVQVDCMWKWRGFALLVGEAPARLSPA